MWTKQLYVVLLSISVSSQLPSELCHVSDCDVTSEKAMWYGYVVFVWRNNYKMQTLLKFPNISFPVSAKFIFSGMQQCPVHNCVGYCKTIRYYSLWGRMSCSLCLRHDHLEVGVRSGACRGASPLTFSYWWWTKEGLLNYWRSVPSLPKVSNIHVWH